MKKVLVALVVLSMASVASAELLASWVTGDVSGAVTAGTNADVVVSGLSLWGDATSTGTTSVWGMRTLTTGGGLQFTISSIAGGQWIEDAVISGTASGSGTGPREMDWFVDGSIVSGQSIVRTSTTATAFENTLGTLNSGDVVSLRADTLEGTVRSGTLENFTNTAGTFYITAAGMELNGNVVIPEPGTMALLGLGGLAILAVRRKMLK
ncbi:MAG TPA: PEP-CTERM sorting domain-containing protein [Kiritimatiellia bacterium]|nr:PEP-CTERM sorting domain-containing protein [Kiritimatiellia bacterium]